MAAARKKRQKLTGPDSITYFPIDRTRSPDDVFHPTDLRAQPAVGGVAIGRCDYEMLLSDEQMPGVTVDHIAQSSDNVVRGRDAYHSLLYLSRIRPHESSVLWQASQSFEIKVRWERLWVLSPYLAKIARYEEGRLGLVDAMKEDLAGVHLLSKFMDQNNPSVKRMFKRLHDPLLTLLMSRLIQYRSDSRRSNLISGIVATFETDSEVLRTTLSACTKIQQEVEDMLALLVVRHRGSRHRLSSGVLRDKLARFKRGF